MGLGAQLPVRDRAKWAEVAVIGQGEDLEEDVAQADLAFRVPGRSAEDDVVDGGVLEHDAHLDFVEWDDSPCEHRRTAGERLKTGFSMSLIRFIPEHPDSANISPLEMLELSDDQILGC